MPRLLEHPALLPLALFLCILSVYLLTASSDLLHNGDTELRYETTQAMVDHHRLWLDNPMYTDQRVSPGVGGHLYAFYAPGQAVLMVPLYILGKAAAHHLSLDYGVATRYSARSLDLFLGALLAVLVFLFAERLGYSRRVSTLLTLIFAFATCAWPDAQSALEETPVALFLLIAAIAVCQWLRRGKQSRRWLVAAGAGAGAAMCTRYDAAVYVAVFSAYVLVVASRDRRLPAALADAATVLAGGVPFGCILALWNVARFGSPVLTGLHEQTFGGNPVAGFLGLLLSPGKGIVWYLPVLFLLPVAATAFARRRDDAAPLFAVMLATPLLFYSTVLFWHGDPAWGPRYLYPAIPYAILPLGELLACWPRCRVALRVCLVAVVVLSLAIQVAAVSVNQWRFWYRLQEDLQRTAHAGTWSGQPFRWGAEHYHYYWNTRQSPLLLQFQGLYQVARLVSGDNAYRLTRAPDPYVHTNTADVYPLNTFGFWWTDVRHPLLGPRRRTLVALSLCLVALISLAAVVSSLRSDGRSSRRRLREVSSRLAGSTGS